jgi:multisubunit Na+/H+ antiporter MnhB subunit
MRNFACRLLMILMLLATSPELFAQDGKDLMRDNGRIYVVVAVMVTILLGLILYLVRIDRKLTKIEKDIHPKQ